MEFAKRTAILLVFALLTLAPARSDTTAPPTAPATTSATATPRIDSASCLVKITASPSVMPITIDTIQYLLESPSVAGKAAEEVLGIKLSETPDRPFKITVEQFTAPRGGYGGGYGGGGFNLVKIQAAEHKRLLRFLRFQRPGRGKSKAQVRHFDHLKTARRTLRSDNESRASA